MRYSGGHRQFRADFPYDAGVGTTAELSLNDVKLTRALTHRVIFG